MLEHEYDIMRQVEDQHWWYAALRNMVVKDVRALLKGRNLGSILDAGCGTGGMLQRLHDADSAWQISGIDFSSQAVAYSQQRGLTDVRQGSVNGLPFDSESRDVIVSLDVLYHEGVNESAALAEFARVLKPGGSLILNLPAFEILRGSHDIAVHGARRYTPQRVAEILKQAGLNVEVLHCWNAFLFPPVLVARLLSRFTNKAEAGETKGDLVAPNPVLNAILTGIAAVDTRLTRLLSCLIGTSVYAVASKPAA